MRAGFGRGAAIRYGAKDYNKTSSATKKSKASVYGRSSSDLFESSFRKSNKGALDDNTAASLIQKTFRGHKVRNDMNRNMSATMKIQKEWRKRAEELRRSRNTFRQIAKSVWFERFILLVVFWTGVNVGLQTCFDDNVPWLQGTNAVILFIFVVEFIIKFFAEWPTPLDYFSDSWNVFDFIIVCVGVIDVFYTAFGPTNSNTGASFLIVLRIFRLFRILKVIKSVRPLEILVVALLESFTSILYIGIIMILMFYIFGVMAVFLFSYNNPQFYNNLFLAMLTLFRVMTCEGWTQVMYVDMYGCETSYDDNIKLRYGCPSDSSGQPYLAVVFYVLYVCVATFITLNLFIGVIMANMDRARHQRSDDNTVNKVEDELATYDTEEHLIQMVVEPGLNSVKIRLHSTLGWIVHLREYFESKGFFEKSIGGRDSKSVGKKEAKSRSRSRSKLSPRPVYQDPAQVVPVSKV